MSQHKNPLAEIDRTLYRVAAELISVRQLQIADAMKQVSDDPDGQSDFPLLSTLGSITELRHFQDTMRYDMEWADIQDRLDAQGQQ